MLSDQLFRVLVMEVVPLVGNLAMGFGNGLDGFLAPMTSTFLSGQGLLQRL